MFVTKNLNCYKMANNGWISIVKVSIGAYGYSTSNNHFRIERVPQPSAGARRRVAIGHPNLLV